MGLSVLGRVTVCLGLPGESLDLLLRAQSPLWFGVGPGVDDKLYPGTVYEQSENKNTGAHEQEVVCQQFT